MTQRERTERLLLEQARKYPRLEIADLFKFLHQSSFGCEHAVSSLEIAMRYIEGEYSQGLPDGVDLTEKLDGNFSRVSLGWIDKGLSFSTFGKLFFASARERQDGAQALVQKLSVARELINRGELPLSLTEFDNAAREWREAGYPALHHSDAYRNSYHPAYRVLSDRYVAHLPLFAEIDYKIKSGITTLSLECEDFKDRTELSEILCELYGQDLLVLP